MAFTPFWSDSTWGTSSSNSTNWIPVVRAVAAPLLKGLKLARVHLASLAPSCPVLRPGMRRLARFA